MGAKSYCLVSALLFGLVAIAHLLRVIYRWPIAVEAWSIPLWISWVAVPVAVALSIWGIWMWNVEGGPQEGPGGGIPRLD